MKYFKVSILIPVHSTDYLKEALVSINMQTFCHELVEVLIILDRVDKEEVESLVRATLVNFEVSLIVSPLPGIVEALNLGLSLARGELVARIDQDDLMARERIAKQVIFLDRNKSCLAVGSSIILVNESLRYLGVNSFPKSVSSRLMRDLLKNPMAHPSVTFRKEIVLALGGYKKNIPEDWDLWLRLSDHGKVKNLCRPLTFYRVHEKQMSRGSMYQIEEARRKIQISRRIFAITGEYSDAPGGSAKEWEESLKKNSTTVDKDLRISCDYQETLQKNKVKARSVLIPLLSKKIDKAYRKLLNMIISILIKKRATRTIRLLNQEEIHE